MKDCGGLHIGMAFGRLCHKQKWYNQGETNHHNGESIGGMKGIFGGTGEPTMGL